MKIGVIQVLLLLLFSGILCLIRGDNTSTSVNFKSSSTEDHTTPDTPTLTQNDSIISPTTIFTAEENSYSTNGPTSPTTVPKNMNTSPTQTKFTTKLSSIISTTSTTESETTTHLTRDSTDIETTFSLTTADIKTSESRHTTDTLLSTLPKTLPSSATTLLSTSTKTLPSSATTLLSTSTKTLPSSETTLLSTLTKTSASLATTSLSTSPKTLTSSASSATSSSPSSTLVTLKTTPNQNRPSSQTKSGMSPGGKAALGIFIVIVLVAAAVLGLLWYRRKYGSVRWTNLTSSVAYKRYTDDDTINMGHVGN